MVTLYLRLMVHRESPGATACTFCTEGVGNRGSVAQQKRREIKALQARMWPDSSLGDTQAHLRSGHKSEPCCSARRHAASAITRHPLPEDMTAAECPHPNYDRAIPLLPANIVRANGCCLLGW